MDVAQRNESAKQFIINKLELASSFTESNFNNLDEYQSLTDTLKNLINVNLPK